MKNIHFIAGLPRSGSTVLSSILNQNPRFQASISGPLMRYLRAIIQESTTQGGYRTECDDEKRKKIMMGIVDNYYDNPEKEVCFHTNRGTPLLFHTIKDMYPDAKLILCVRDVVQVLNSFEWLIRKQPYEFTTMFSSDEGINVYSRAETILNGGRTVGFAYNALKQGITSEHKSSIMIIEYEKLAKNPEFIMKTLYNFIGEPYFDHDFNDVEESYPEFDEEVNLKNLHTTRKKVSFIEKEMIIPPDLIQMVNANFPSVWK